MSAAKICPQCSNEYALDQRFCPLDGATLKAQGPANDLVGSVVADRYYVLRKLGEGGMGQVYLAEHVRMGRKSALKVMNPSMVQDADAISRFNREASNASRISHPNVAAIYDFGETGDGLIYLAMEYVEGEALTQLVERSGALPPLRAADIIRQTGEALTTAHDMGIVHRDLKPDNIMIAKSRDGSDCVKVVDFGIAKSNEGSQKVTKTGLVVGTPEYMSPEQLAGDKLDGRSDIYSLGLVAFNLLTGKLPFPSESAQESMIMRLTDRPMRLAEMRSEVPWPAELQAVLDRALERDAKLRYASAAEFGRDFARMVEAMPEAAAMTAGTQVLDASAVVPPTRVGAGADAGATAVIDSPAPGRGPSALPPVAPPPAGARIITGRTPMLAAAAVIVVLGIGAAGMKFFGSPEADAARDSLAAVSPPVASEKTDVEGTPAPPPPADAVQFGAAAEKAAPPRGSVQPGGTIATADRPEASPRNPPPVTPPRESAEEVLRRVERLTASEATAQEALAELDRLARTLVLDPDERIWERLLRAEAYGQLNQVGQMCTVLGTIEGRSSNASRNGRIEGLRMACP